jgi:hypothetical protein
MVDDYPPRRRAPSRPPVRRAPSRPPVRRAPPRGPPSRSPSRSPPVRRGPSSGQRGPPVRRGPSSGQAPPRGPPLRRGPPSSRPRFNNPYKSRGENWIGSFLKEAGIKFHYEYPVVIVDDDKKVRIWYPDFWLPELNIVIEYFGMMNDEQYREAAEKKLQTFKKLNVDFIGVNTNMIQLDKNWEKFIIMEIMGIMESKKPIYRRLEQLKKKYTWD